MNFARILLQILIGFFYRLNFDRRIRSIYLFIYFKTKKEKEILHAIAY